MTACCPLEGSDPSERPSFQRVTRPMARRVHPCCECHAAIAVGATYECVSGRWDQSFSTYRTCLSCVEIRNHFACDGWIYGQLWEDLERNLFPGMRAGGPCMRGLSPEAKARLFERRLRWPGRKER